MHKFAFQNLCLVVLSCDMSCIPFIFTAGQKSFNDGQLPLPSSRIHCILILQAAWGHCRPFKAKIRALYTALEYHNQFGYPSPNSFSWCCKRISEREYFITNLLPVTVLCIPDAGIAAKYARRCEVSFLLSKVEVCWSDSRRLVICISCYLPACNFKLSLALKVFSTLEVIVQEKTEKSTYWPQEYDTLTGLLSESHSGHKILEVFSFCYITACMIAEASERTLERRWHLVTFSHM